MKRFIRYQTFLLLGFLGCSSVPDFKPSRPPEEASSFLEALEICSEYHIKGEQNSSGAPKPARVAVLTPWIRCFEKILSQFSDSQSHPSFIALFRALHDRRQSANPPDAEIIDWVAMNVAVKAGVDHLRLSYSFTSDQRKTIEQALPQYALFLAENGTFGKPASEFKPEHGDLEIRQISMELKKERRSGSLRVVSLDRLQKEYCKRYRNFQDLVYDLTDLERYRFILQNKTGQLRTKIEDRFLTLKKEVLQERIDLKKEFASLREKFHWFENKHCL